MSKITMKELNRFEKKKSKWNLFVLEKKVYVMCHRGKSFCLTHPDATDSIMHSRGSLLEDICFAIDNLFEIKVDIFKNVKSIRQVYTCNYELIDKKEKQYKFTVHWKKKGVREYIAYLNTDHIFFRRVK